MRMHRVMQGCLVVLRHFSLPPSVQCMHDVVGTAAIVVPEFTPSIEHPPSLKTLSDCIELCDPRRETAVRSVLFSFFLIE